MLVWSSNQIDRVTRIICAHVIIQTVTDPTIFKLENVKKKIVWQDSVLNEIHEKLFVLLFARWTALVTNVAPRNGRNSNINTTLTVRRRIYRLKWLENNFYFFFLTRRWNRSFPQYTTTRRVSSRSRIENELNIKLGGSCMKRRF